MNRENQGWIHLTKSCDSNGSYMELQNENSFFYYNSKIRSRFTIILSNSISLLLLLHVHGVSNFFWKTISIIKFTLKRGIRIYSKPQRFLAFSKNTSLKLMYTLSSSWILFTNITKLILSLHAYFTQHLSIE